MPRTFPAPDRHALANPHTDHGADRRYLSRYVSSHVAHEHAAVDPGRNGRADSGDSGGTIRPRQWRPLVFVVFPALGRNYDAAVVSAGFGGISMGSTPTAMANMSAVTTRYGASHLAFIIVPLVCAFFIDLANAILIPAFLTHF